MTNYAKIRIIILLVTIISIVFSTYICILIDAKIHNKFILKKINTFEQYEKDKVFFSSDTISISKDIFNTASIIGWSFVETSQKNDNRYVRFYFISDKYTYCIDTILSWREIFMVFKEKKIQGREHGFSTEFSTLAMKDGVYNIYLENYENEENYGIVNIKKVLVKKNGKVTIEPFIKEAVKKEINERPISKNGVLQCYIDNIHKNNKIYKVFGWAYLKDINKTGKIYVGIKDKSGKEEYYTTELVERPDVVKHFNNNSDLLNSGFETNIKFNDIENYQLSSIIIEYDGKYYRQKIENKQINAENLETSSKYNFSDKNILTNHSVLSNIDKIDNINGRFLVSGWAYIKDKKKTGKVYVGMKGKTGKETYYTVEPIERPDVVKHFNNVDLLNSGFTANIKIDNIEDYQLSSIVIEYDGKYYKKALK